jgi:hypothetical protein
MAKVIRIRKWTIIAALACVISIQAGCDDEAKPANISPQPSSATEVAQLKQEKNQLEQQLRTLTQENENLKQVQSVIDSFSPEQAAAFALQAVLDQQPALKPWTQLQTWSKIVVSDPSQNFSIELADPRLLESLGPDLVLQGYVPDPYPGGIPNACPVQLTSGSITYKANLISRDYIELPELSPGYFKVNDDLSALLCDTFLPAPSYLPEPSMDSLISQSTVMKLLEQNIDYYFTSKFRVDSVYEAFWSSHPIMLSKLPNLSEADFPLHLTFYRSGKAVDMHVYARNVRISDGRREQWYETDEQVRTQINGSLHAG